MQKNTIIHSGELDTMLFFEGAVVRRILPEKEGRVLETMMTTLPHDIKQSFIDTTVLASHNMPGKTIFLHRKISFIHYPHEWCTVMFQDALRFELQLLKKLYQHGFFLKDLHLWNVLLDKGHYRHVDFPSLIYFDEAAISDFARLQQDMIVPYGIFPLLGLTYGKKAWVRNKIFSTTLNASSSTITMRDLFPAKQYNARTLKNGVKLLLALWRWRLLVKAKIPLEQKIERMIAFVDNMSASVGKSDYSHYYVAKKEDQRIYDVTTHFNAKQKNVWEHLRSPDIETVCDVACNTGWYAKLAAHLGKTVVAFDIDESCIEVLYREVCAQSLDIVPLVASFMALSPERYAMDTGKKILLSAQERFRSDCVLALGILHHLILGENETIEVVIEQLAMLSKRSLILEFITLEDDKIANHRDFFPAYHRHPEAFSHYEINHCIAVLKQHFSRVYTVPSSELTRMLLIAEKEGVSS